MDLKKLCGILLIGTRIVFADLDPQQKNLIADTLHQLNPGFNIENVKIEEMPELNLYKIIDQKNIEVLFLSKDGRYFFYGELLDLKQSDRKSQNITENAKKEIRKAEINSIPKKNMIIFKPDLKNWGMRKPLGQITVFTDLTCPYGLKLHKEVVAAVKEGLEVRYVFFPRGGMKSDGSKKAMQVYCAKNRLNAFTTLASGKELIDPKECDNPTVKDLYDLGLKIGVMATPSIVLADGSLVPGYMESKELVNLVTTN